jgi:hypothetical protein
MNPTKPTGCATGTAEGKNSDLDEMIIEHVMPFIANLPRDQPYIAKQMFDKATWDEAPNLYGQRISYLEKSGRLPLIFHERLSNNSRTYWITL